MTRTIAKTGKCLCGKVEFKAAAVQPTVHACHCNMCQLWNGGPTLSVHCGSEVTISNPEMVSVYRSCDWAELGFCKHCGSHLFYRAIDTGEYILQTGSFDSADGFELRQQMFIEEKPPFYGFANDTENLTGEQVFALYGASED